MKMTNLMKTMMGLGKQFGIMEAKGKFRKSKKAYAELEENAAVWSNEYLKSDDETNIEHFLKSKLKKYMY